MGRKTSLPAISARAARRVLCSRMDTNVSALERAFHLAKTGEFATVAEIKIRLQAEGYYASQIEGAQLNKQLKALIAGARGKS